MNPVRTIDTALIGLGNVNRNFLRILEMKEAELAQRYGLAFRVVCVADSSGVAVNPAGFDPAATRQAKEAGHPVRTLPGFVAGASPAEVLATLACDLVLEASPVDLTTGEPGLGVTRATLARGIPVVLANKGPLVLAYRELHDLAASTGAGLAFSATVCGALPVINIGRRDLIAAEIQSLRGIFNATTNFILAEMATGRSYADALAEAQRRGIEGDKDVVDAKDGVAEAERRVADAADQVREAQRRAAQVITDAKGRVKEATERVEKATLDEAAAWGELNEAQFGATAGVVAHIGALNALLATLEDGSPLAIAVEKRRNDLLALATLAAITDAAQAAYAQAGQLPGLFGTAATLYQQATGGVTVNQTFQGTPQEQRRAMAVAAGGFFDQIARGAG